jgi:hypothetical protein
MSERSAQDVSAPPRQSPASRPTPPASSRTRKPLGSSGGTRRGAPRSGPLSLLRSALRLLAIMAAVALLGRCFYPAPPPRTLEGLADMLGHASGGMVLPPDIAWEPSPGIVVEFFWGRRLLFLSRRADDGARDLYRARVRVTLEGRPVVVAGLHNLTATPLGDEQALVMGDGRAAFATSSYAKVESITMLDLKGRPKPSRASFLDTLTNMITNWRETGTPAGIGRIDVGLDAPSKAVGLEFDGGRLVVEPAGSPAFAVNAGTGELEGSSSELGAHLDVTPTLHKTLILWAVDTVRAEVGPEPVARLESWVWTARDWYRRAAYGMFGPSKEALLAPVEATPPVRPVVDAADAESDGSVWPPAPIRPIFKRAEPGEGQWEAVTYPWLKHLGAGSSPPPTTNAAFAPPQPIGPRQEPPPYFYRTMVRPDAERPYAQVLIVAMDMRQLELDMQAGVEDPKPLTGQHGTGRIPRDPAVLSRVVGAFNGAFKTTHGAYGMMVHRRILLPPKSGAATVVVTQDGRVGLGTWPQSTAIPDDVVSFRQNLEPLVEEGKLTPSGRTQWGFSLPGTSIMTERSGLCTTGSGQLFYLWGDEVSATTLGRAMILAGCSYGIHLDMNPHHTGFVFANFRSAASRDYDVKLLTPQMEISPDRYIEYSPKDFFYLMLRNPKPPGDLAWKEDIGAQPAPNWVPSVWSALAPVASLRPDAAITQVELTAFDSTRVRFRVRSARREGPQREFVSGDLGRDDAHRVIAALGLGNALESRPSPGRPGMARLVAEEDQGLAVTKAPPSGATPAEESVDLPLIFDDGKILASALEPRAMRRRGAACITNSGHAVIALATADSDEPTALALLRVGCTRAVALDRGSHQPTFLHRTGAGASPLGRYGESVLYALGRSLTPRTFRWNQAPP